MSRHAYEELHKTSHIRLTLANEAKVVVL